MQTEHVSCPVFRGLQRPLEFMGLQGRYIYWGAGAIGGAIAGFILGYCLLGFVAGLVALVAALCLGGALVLTRQRKGLHTKKSDKGIFIFCRSRSL